ncbi:MAG: transglutaminase domain-containing protein, partial [Candidatus Zixiibacteriota bacterium]
CPTGLTYDGKNLWLADRKSDLIYKINPSDGSVLQSFQAPCYYVGGLTASGNGIWVLDAEENLAYYWNPQTNICEKTISIPSGSPQGLAWDGKYLWVADFGDDKLYQISTEDGTTIIEIPSPSGNPQGLTYDGNYLWVSDRLDDMIYMVMPENGNVILAFDAPSKYARGLAYDGEFLWNVDYQSDSLYKIILDDTAAFVRKDGKKQHLEFSEQFRNYGPGEITSLDLYFALPHDLPFQKMLDTLVFDPQPKDFLTDKWDQKVAHFHFENIPAGEFVTVSMTASAELYKTRFFVFPEKVGSLSDIPKNIKDKYLADDTKYWVEDPYIRESARNAVGNETNCYWIARKLFNFIIEKLEYERVGGWNVAPTVLKRGTGSCSEYSFVYIALCRAVGLPARYAGSVVIRGDDASTDDVFHRWVEVYLSNYGWIPIDPSGGDSDRPSAQASAIGYLNNRFLITTIGGGSSEYLEWGYNANEKWQSRGPCKIYVEAIGEWSPIEASE